MMAAEITEPMHIGGEAEGWSLDANEGWQKFVWWMRIHASIDLDRLTDYIHRQLEIKLNFHYDLGELDGYIGNKELFDLMLVRLAMLGAAIVALNERRQLRVMENQIQQHFPQQWTRLLTEWHEGFIPELKDKVRELCQDPDFCQQPDEVINTFRPQLVGVTTYSEEIGDEFPPVNEGMDAIGPPLYKSTLRASSRALVGAIRLRFVLNKLVEQEKKQSEEKKAESSVTVGR